MSHPIRPDKYIEINNFYTMTVYQKGAEVVRMYHTLLGEEGFQRGLRLYLERHDHGAVTCDDFLAAMADANGRDLQPFSRWYGQSGTPEISRFCHTVSRISPSPRSCAILASPRICSQVTLPSGKATPIQFRPVCFCLCTPI